MVCEGEREGEKARDQGQEKERDWEFTQDQK